MRFSVLVMHRYLPVIAALEMYCRLTPECSTCHTTETQVSNASCEYIPFKFCLHRTKMKSCGSILCFLTLSIFFSPYTVLQICSLLGCLLYAKATMHSVNIYAGDFPWIIVYHRCIDIVYCAAVTATCVQYNDLSDRVITASDCIRCSGVWYF